MTSTRPDVTAPPSSNGHAATAADGWPDHADAGTPPDLLPRTGNDAYERTSCTSIFLTHVPEVGELTDVTGTQIDLAEPAGELGLFTAPAEGVVLTTEQSWYARGVTLGQLAHSLALAPGEATRIAVVDWARRTSGSDTGTDTQTDTSTAASDRGRSISEIANALAQEEQHGETIDTADSASASVSASVGYAGLAWSGSASMAASYTHDSATHVSRASGTRQLSSENAQRLADRTEQQATALRSRRATVVQETSQAESNQVSTRIVANYNHMHALSVQYYEVVQLFELHTCTRRIERCVFLPMKVQDFTGPAGSRLLRRHHLLFAAVAPPAWQDRFRDYDPTAFTTVRCSAAVPPPAAVDSKSTVAGVDTRGDSWAFDWHRPETSARQLELWWDGDKVRAVRLTMADGQQTPTWGDGGYNYESITFDPGDVPTGRQPSTLKSVKTGYSGYRGGALGAVAITTSDGRELTTGPAVATQALDPEHVDGKVITGIYGKCSSSDGWNYMASLGFYVRPATTIATPFATTAGAMPVRRLRFWSDSEKVRAVSVEVDGTWSTYGDPRADDAAKSYRYTPVDLAAGEQVVRIIVRTTAAHRDDQPGQEQRVVPGAIGQVVIQTTGPQTVTAGASSAPPQGWADEQAVDVRTGDLTGVFGTAALYDGDHFFTELGFTVRVPQTPPQPLLEHLQDNALYYNQALWAGVDPLALAGALAHFTYDPPRPDSPPEPAYSTIRAVGDPCGPGDLFDRPMTAPVRRLEVADDGTRLVGIRMSTAAGDTAGQGPVSGPGLHVSRITFLPGETVASVGLGATEDGSAPARLELVTSTGRTFAAGPPGGPAPTPTATPGCVLAGCFGSSGADTDSSLTSLGLWSAPAWTLPEPTDSPATARPLAACVDPVPIAMTQNYLGFRWHFPTEDARLAWLAAEQLEEGEATEVVTRVSLPTGGLFAEAVLGRSVAAERLDLTRFWNWQDSPNPFAPTDIEAPSTASRQSVVELIRPEAAPTSAVAPPVQDAPDPSGAAAVLTALTDKELINPALTQSAPTVSRAGAVLNAALDLEAKRAAAAAEKVAEAKAAREKEAADKEAAEKAAELKLAAEKAAADKAAAKAAADKAAAGYGTGTKPPADTKDGTQTEEEPAEHPDARPGTDGPEAVAPGGAEVERPVDEQTTPLPTVTGD